MLKRIFLCLLLIAVVVSSVLTVAALPLDISENNMELSSEKYLDYISNQSESVGKGKLVKIAANSFQSIDSGVVSVKDGLEWKAVGGSVIYDVTVIEDGAYEILLEYKPLENSSDAIELSFMIDGKCPFAEAKSVFFNRAWENDGKLRLDDEGNEFAAKVKQVNGWLTNKAYDPTGFNVKPLMVVLESGMHEFTITSRSNSFVLKSVSLVPETGTLDYENYIEGYKNTEDYSKTALVLEGESASVRSKKTIIPLSDNSSAYVQPQNAFLNKINYIGSNNWSRPGDSIIWDFDVENDGLYSLKFNYRQNYTINETFYRTLMIDGEIPFRQAESIEFPYSGDWKECVFSNEKEQPYKIYLSKGKHTLSLSVTMGPHSEVCSELNNLVYELAGFYRSIVMITGENPDSNRDYNLFTQISDYDGRLKSYSETLDRVTQMLSEISGGNSGSALTNLRNMKDVVEHMRNNKYYAHQYKDRFYSNYAALSAWVYERSSMPLDIDAIFFDAPDNSSSVRGRSFFNQISFSVKRFLSSFVSQYQNEVHPEDDNDNAITLWINWGRDQAKVLKNLVSSDFKVKTGINVNIKITNATLLQGILSGEGPDCSLQVSRSEPVNLAMRGALYDFSNFKDYEEIMKRFMPGADVPYTYKSGHYGIPNTQLFYMLFYRSDIFEQMGVTVPETWDEFINISNMFMRKNMQVGLPYVQISDMSQVNAGVGALNIFPTLLMQKGISLYNNELTASTLMTPETVETFVQWVDYYNKFGFPKSYDFYNRFRIGLMPMAVVNYTMYATLTAAAPEISQFWKMAPVPGYKREDGTVDHTVSGGGTAAIILKESSHPELAWEFIKWWTESDTQYTYASEVENILGTAARHDTANVEALKKLSWDKDNLSALLEQWSYVKEIPEIPGGYYMARVLDQAFWNTTNGQDPYEMISKWGRVADSEIARKEKQYGDKK